MLLKVNCMTHNGKKANGTRQKSGANFKLVISLVILVFLYSTASVVWFLFVVLSIYLYFYRFTFRNKSC